MKPLTSRLLTVLGALLVLSTLNWAIVGKERIKRSGETVFLALAPVDPRSLVQGDYMALRFAIARDIEAGAAAGAREGSVARVPIALDERRIARIAAGDAAVSLRLRYRIRHGQVWLGTNAFFFEEGSADRFAAARYGEFRVDRDGGEAVLVGLRDQQLGPL